MSCALASRADTVLKPDWDILIALFYYVKHPKASVLCLKQLRGLLKAATKMLSPHIYLNPSINAYEFWLDSLG